MTKKLLSTTVEAELRTKALELALDSSLHTPLSTPPDTVAIILRAEAFFAFLTPKDVVKEDER
jgi:hypothetical protein